MMLDDLIAQLESPQPFERALVLAELRRLQARERRLEELEAEWSTRRVPSARCARQLRAARGEHD